MVRSHSSSWGRARSGFIDRCPQLLARIRFAAARSVPAPARRAEFANHKTASA